MRVRRCGIVFFEPRESTDFDLLSLFKGGSGISRKIRWLALAPHLDAEVEVTGSERELLGRLSAEEWIESTALEAYPSELIQTLLKKGLLVSDGDGHGAMREQDERNRSAHWWPIAALAHKFSRWHGSDSVAAMEAGEMATAAGLRSKLGAPPAEAISRLAQGRQSLPLPRLEPDAYEKLASRRVTCRNFDLKRPLGLELFTRMMQRVVMAQKIVRVHDDMAFLKKNVPSGGGLHPTEIYLLVNRVEGVSPGLYHYHPVDHALEPMPAPVGSLAAAAREMLAGQHWFADAPVQLILAPRYARSFWKYRHHSKAYRAVVLDVGHISQAIYASATELGLAAFVTSAINEVDVERTFGLDPLLEGPLAIAGFGWRAGTMTTAEFDPAEAVWETGARSLS